MSNSIQNKCPFCNSELISLVLPSNPPQYKTYCPNCENSKVSNSTQNDEIEVDGETYVKWDTQNDWAKRIAKCYLLIRDAFWDEYLDHNSCGHDIGCVVTSDPLEKKVSLAISKLLADARREVIDGLESKLEELAEIEHDQWWKWAKTLMDKETLSKERIERWQKDMVPYKDLPEEVKEYDRKWARKVLATLRKEEAK